MIYITAQRVHFGRSGASSINAFQHRPDGRVDLSQDPFFTIDQVTQDAGELIAANVTVPPGGNAVEAYLDVVANDNFDVSMLNEVIGSFRDALAKPTSNELAAPVETALVRYYYRPTLDRISTYDQLSDAVCNLFLNPHVPVPLTVLVEQEEDKVVFHLDDEGTKRMQLIHGLDWQRPRVRVSEDVLHDFQSMQGDITEHLVDVVTGLDAQYVKGLGGVRFVSPTGDERRWPDAVK